MPKAKRIHTCSGAWIHAYEDSTSRGLETSSTTKTNLRCEENNPRSRQSQSVEMISLGLFLIICLSFEAASGASTIIRNPCTWKYHQLSPFDSVRPIPKPHFPDHHYRWRRNRNYLSPRSSVVDQGLRRCYAIHNTVGSEGTPIFDEKNLEPGSLLTAIDDNSGLKHWIEVLDKEDNGVVKAVALMNGRKVHLQRQAESGVWKASVIGWSIDDGSRNDWVSKYPLFDDFALKMKDQEAIVDGRQEYILQDLRVDGTAPEDGAMTPLQSNLLSASELLALMNGLRGVVMIQLSALWGGDAENLIYRPFVTTLLRKIAEDESSFAIFTSPAPEELGLSAIICAPQQPYLNYAFHLASFGCQASVVAQSAYYKALVGSLLGYKRENIIHHILTNPNSQGGEPPPSPQRLEKVFIEVDKEMQGLFDTTYSSPSSSMTTSKKWSPKDNLPPVELRKFVRDSQEKLLRSFQNDVAGGNSDIITDDEEKTTKGGKNTGSLEKFKKKLKKNRRGKAGGGGFGAR
eukprot:jgi/Bigna1/80027/fgenesh1_pg.67_\